MKSLFALTAAAFLTLGANAAPAQQNCAPRALVVDRLAQAFGESRQSIGMGPQGRVFEVFASLETRTWTIVITLPSGVTCLVASGDAFEILTEDLQPAGVQG